MLSLGSPSPPCCAARNRVQDLVTQSKAALRRSLPDDERHILDDLSDVDSRISVKIRRGPGKDSAEVHAQQLDELRKERDRLWNELAQHSALVQALDHPVTIEDIQQALPPGGALVELTQYAPQHDDTGVHLRKHDPKPPPHYAAYLVFPNHFDWVDLGPSAPIDEHVKAFRNALRTKQALPDRPLRHGHATHPRQAGIVDEPPGHRPGGRPEPDPLRCSP